MKNEEWIVEVDEDDNLVGKIQREEAHNTSNLKLHREVMCLLYTDTTRKNFLLQQRSTEKKQWPGFWTLSVTGHVDFADISEFDPEGYLTAAGRESYEEIGVKTKDLKLVGKIVHKNDQNWAMMGIVEGEYTGELKLDTAEVSGVKIFNKDTIVEVSDKLTFGAKACLEFLEILKK